MISGMVSPSGRFFLKFREAGKWELYLIQTFWLRLLDRGAELLSTCFQCCLRRQRPENIPTDKTPNDILGFVRKLLGYSHKQSIYFRWRPSLKDPNDDFVLELAIASQSSYIVTFNAKDFTNIELFGIEILSPSEFLKLVTKIWVQYP